MTHWDDLEEARPTAGFIGASWRNLGEGSKRLGAQRIDLAPGEIPTPPHVHHDAEEIFFVLEGSGLSWQDGIAYEIRAGDTLIHRVNAEAHTLRAGDDGLSVIAFGQRSRGFSATLPRTKMRWAWPFWIEVGGGSSPWEREAELGPPDFSDRSAERPETIRAFAGVEAGLGGRLRPLAPHALTQHTALNHVTLHAGETGAPRHVHSAEEELFVVLEGGGTLYLGEEELPVRPGHVVARPAGSRVAHGFRAGSEGLVYLAYGERRPEDICFYPTSGRISFRGLGLIGRLEQLPYPGEPDLF